MKYKDAKKKNSESLQDRQRSPPITHIKPNSTLNSVIKSSLYEDIKMKFNKYGVL